jgi:hypothetical protein
VRHEVVVDEDGVALLPGTMLERERDEVTEPTPRQRVLVREEAIVRLHTELVAVGHGLGEQKARHLPGGTRGDRRCEEEPRVRAMPRSRALDRGRDAGAPAGLRERQHVVGPGSLVEVGSDEPACLIREQRVSGDDVPPLEVIEDDLIRHRAERLVRTLPALDTGLLADAPYPFIRACRRVPLSAGRRVGPELRVQVVAAPEELAEQGHLFGGSPGWAESGSNGSAR